MIARSIASCPGSEYTPSLSESGLVKSCCAYASRCSIAWTLVTHRSYVPLPRVSVSPLAERGASEVRIVYASKPTPCATRSPSPPRRPLPRYTVTQSFGCPGTISTGAITLRPFRSSSMASFSSMLRRVIVYRLISAALSHESDVTGLGNSCSQPLFENRPSYSEGSGRNEISIPPAVFAGAAGTVAPPPLGAPTDFAVNAVPATQPSCSALRQPVAKSPVMYVFAFATTASYALVEGSISACSTSWALLPPYIGSIIG